MLCKCASVTLIFAIRSHAELCLRVAFRLRDQNGRGPSYAKAYADLNAFIFIRFSKYKSLFAAKLGFNALIYSSRNFFNQIN